MLVAVNADGEPYVAHFDAGCGLAWDLITGEQHDFGGGSELPPYSAYYWEDGAVTHRLSPQKKHRRWRCFFQA